MRELVHISTRVGLVPDGSGQSGRAASSGPTGVDPLASHVKNRVSRSVSATLAWSQRQSVVVGLTCGAVAVAVSGSPILGRRVGQRDKARVFQLLKFY